MFDLQDVFGERLEMQKENQLKKAVSLANWALRLHRQDMELKKQARNLEETKLKQEESFNSLSAKLNAIIESRFFLMRKFYLIFSGVLYGTFYFRWKSYSSSQEAN